MKLNIDKTYTLSLWQIINSVLGLSALGAAIFYSVNDNYQKATFYAVLYVAVLLYRLEDKLMEDVDEEDTTK